ncbi:MAG: hydantoinase/oxoprolinase N-terminal domain-containing protein [Gammaproteobacteria bacterium]
MKRYLIGVDTGGTYTDAVIVDAENHAVLASAKSLTTHGDLAKGIGASLESVFNSTHISPADIQQVSLSTTLATNALVEGRGSSVAVILIGFDDAMIARTNIESAAPDAKVIAISGGHKYDGHEQAPLDESALIQACKDSDVDAFAVASHYAVRNPAHERRAAQLIQELTGKPVSASCDLSDSLNGPLRALTATFNARIISLIINLQIAVANAIAQLGINAPIMIVKGDGSIAAAGDVIEKPIETILSGPAASVIGARFLTRLNDFVVADMGGTTTDVATVLKGWPKLSARGANIGGYRTLVKAIDMQTIGLGGDSCVDIDESSNLTLSSSRVVPISMLAKHYPVVEQELRAALGATSGMRSALDYLIVNANPNAEIEAVLSSREKRFIHTLDRQRPNKTSRVLHTAADRSCAKALIDRGILRQSGFTPSDAAHVLNAQNQWSRSGAVAAAELLGRSSYRFAPDDTERQVLEFCRDVINLAVRKSTHLIINELSGESFTEDDALVSAVASGSNTLGKLNLAFKATLPLVAVGGPAQVFYPEAGQRLNVDTIIPKHSDVANAVGAAVGIVRAESCVEITLSETGGYLVHGGGDPELLDNASVALAKAEELARTLVQEDFAAKGGRSSHVSVDIESIQVPNVTDGGLISARVRARCDSMPD